MRQARDLAHILGDEAAEARILWNLLLLNVYTGDDREQRALSHFMLGFIYYWKQGEIDRALASMEADIAVAERVHSLTPLIGTRADLGLLYGELGDIDRGLALANQARITAEKQLPILRFWPLASTCARAISPPRI